MLRLASLSVFHRTSHSYSRSMSSKHNFLVYAPDCTDSDAFTRRMSVRPTHLDGARLAESAGRLKVGGALLTPESIMGGKQTMVGSVLIFEAETLDEVKSMVLSDIYYTSRVWDLEKLVILPFVQGAGFVKLA